jgi:hypothetical protein
VCAPGCPKHPDTLTTMGNLAVSMRDMGDLPGARELQEKVVGARTRALGLEHPDTWDAMATLAVIRAVEGAVQLLSHMLIQS